MLYNIQKKRKKNKKINCVLLQASLTYIIKKSVCAYVPAIAFLAYQIYQYFLPTISTVCMYSMNLHCNYVSPDAKLCIFPQLQRLPFLHLTTQWQTTV